MYVEEREITERSSRADTLHLGLLQAIASVELLLDGWCEPPDLGALQLSTLVQQVLSVIAQFGGARADETWRALCGSGPFAAVDPPTFGALLRVMGARDLVQQCEDGTLILGMKGERIVGHYGFFAVFQSPAEVRVLHEGRLVGTVSPTFALAEGLYLVLAGRRWRVVAVAPHEGAIEVVPAPGGRVPNFEAHGYGLVHDRVRQAMRSILEGSQVPVYLDRVATELLAEARANASRLGLARRRVLADGQGVLAFVWAGDRVVSTLARLLARAGLGPAVHGPAIRVQRATVEQVDAALVRLLGEGPVEPTSLAEGAPNSRLEKYDGYLSDELLALEYASRMVDVPGALRAARELLDG